MIKNPWLTIWFNPKEAYKQVLENQKSRDSFLLCFIAGLNVIVSSYFGIISFLTKAAQQSGDPNFTPLFLNWTVLIIEALLLAWPVGYLISYLSTLGLWAAGKILLKTKKSLQKYRVVVLWRFAFMLPLLLCVVAQGSNPQPLFFPAFATLTISLFSLRAQLYGLSVLENISKWRAFGLLVICWSIMLLLTVIFIFGTSFISTLFLPKMMLGGFKG